MWSALVFLLSGAYAVTLAAANVEVYVSYAENEHPGQAFMPNPWYGSPNTIFLGYPTSAPPSGTVLAWDSGGILIRNVGTSDVRLGQGVKVDGFADPTRSYLLWDNTGFLGSMGIPAGGVTIAPGQQLILAQTAASRMTGTDFAATPCNRKATPPLLCYSNFDTSDTPVGATGSTATPVIHLMLDGVMQTFADTGQVLNTAGADFGNLNPSINESMQWRLIGTTGPYLPGGSGVNPPAVTTYHNDNGRTGLNASETTLNPQSVNCLSGNRCNFGKLFTYPVDGAITAQPLFVPSVLINGARHNTVFVTTDNNSVYAFDAESAVPVSAGLPLWKRNFGSNGTTGFQVYSTPVIDTAANTLYVVSNSNGTAALLHALDLGSGGEFKTTPTTIGGFVKGTGDGSSGQTITFSTFDPTGPSLFQRPALLLYNGSVYIAFGSNGDRPPYHGWIFGYSTANIAYQTAIYNSTPNANSTPATASCAGYQGWVPAGGAFWMTGSGPASDANGIYAATANGTFDTTGDYGDSVLRLLPGLPMKVADYYTPYNQATLNCDDLDLGSSGPLLIPNTSLLIQAAKNGTIYLLNRNSLGKYNSSCTSAGPPCEGIVQALTSVIGNPVGPNMLVYGSPAYFNNTVFYKANQDYLKAFSFVAGQFVPTPVTAGSNTTESATPSVSAYAPLAASGIVWIVENESGAAVLHAFSADLMQELYKSSALSSDNAGPAETFNPPPTIAAGKVFVATGTQLAVYGGALAFPLQTDTLTVTLNVVPADNRSKFNVLIDGTQQLTGVVNSATTGQLMLASGYHVVSVAFAPGAPYLISYSGACQANGAVTLQPGFPANCTITASLQSCPLGEVWNPAVAMCQTTCPPPPRRGCPKGLIWSNYDCMCEKFPK